MEKRPTPRQQAELRYLKACAWKLFRETRGRGARWRALVDGVQGNLALVTEHRAPKPLKRDEAWLRRQLTTLEGSR